MNSNKKIASAIGAKTARACDSCVKKRARWYCAADDAFLCQSCDSSVHSANPLAQRHERVRLKTASFKPINDASSLENCTPAWHQGFTRKARTPRHAKHFKAESQPFPNPLPLVPQLGNDETSLDDNEEQLLYRVPIFDPFLAEFCETTPQVNDATAPAISPVTNEFKDISVYSGENIPGFLPSDMDLAEFAADVESLLGRGFDEDSFGMEGLGLLNSKEEDTNITSTTTEFCYENQKVNKDVKEEEVEAVVACQMDPELDMSRETLDLNFDYMTGEEETEHKVKEGEEDMNMNMMTMMNGEYKTEEISKKVFLRLDYDAIMASWASQGSPWMTGDRPEFNLDDCWPDFHGTCSMDIQQAYGDGGGGTGGHGVVGDGGREARVSRYREKRRTRLFSKKIRYEVRKLNAEKRPRMKGRFVKRTSFAGPGFSF